MKLLYKTTKTLAMVAGVIAITGLFEITATSMLKGVIEFWQERFSDTMGDIVIYSIFFCGIFSILWGIISLIINKGEWFPKEAGYEKKN